MDALRSLLTSFRPPTTAVVAIKPRFVANQDNFDTFNGGDAGLLAVASTLVATGKITIGLQPSHR